MRACFAPRWDGGAYTDAPTRPHTAHTRFRVPAHAHLPRRWPALAPRYWTDRTFVVVDTGRSAGARGASTSRCGSLTGCTTPIPIGCRSLTRCATLIDPSIRRTRRVHDLHRRSNAPIRGPNAANQDRMRAFRRSRTRHLNVDGVRTTAVRRSRLPLLPRIARCPRLIRVEWTAGNSRARHCEASVRHRWRLSGVHSGRMRRGQRLSARHTKWMGRMRAMSAGQ